MSDLEKANATQIANIEKSTGKKLSEWIAIVNKSGFSKHGELVNFLKEKHGLRMEMQIWWCIMQNKVMPVLRKAIRIGSPNNTRVKKT